MKIKTDNIFQVIELDCSVNDAYKVLIDSQILSKLTGMTASMELHEGGVFHAWNNRCHGYMLHLKANTRIVQAWRHDDFPEGLYSIVVMDFEGTETGSRISFNQTGVPEEASGWLTEAWKKDFWVPISEHLNDKVLL
jgi:activator of HSP90 ATPase